MRNYLRCSATLAIGLMMCLAFLCTDSLAAVTGYQGVAFERMPSGSIGPKIRGVIITFVSENGQVRRTASTDNNGAYRIDLNSGRYRVTAQHPDYDDYSSAPGFFVVTGRQYQTGNIFLKKKMVTTILLIRHAEKAATPPDDPPLTPAGQVRANELIHVAVKAGVKAIFATGALRSKQTVQPLATHLNIPITIYSDYAGLKNKVLTNYAGGVVVVAGHADTLQVITTTFGGEANKCTVTGNEFDNLCVINVYGTGKANVINLQYGAPSQ
jgi:2,3-bisphosphoglycerate-dependent phosphoglycerate mutase